jgi:hypothetical protein
MTLVEGLKTAEALLEQVSVRGGADCKNMANGIELIQLVRMEIERQEQEGMKRGSNKDAGGEWKPEGTASTV